MNDTYGIHYWRILRSSYRKLAWVGFEPTTTEFRSDALTNWTIRPWVQLALRPNFVQLLEFHLFVQCSRFISAIVFASRHICFNWYLAQVITWVQWNEPIHMISRSNWNILWTHTMSDEFAGKAHMVSIYSRKCDIIFRNKFIRGEFTWTTTRGCKWNILWT